jgi:hypothetical protein
MSTKLEHSRSNSNKTGQIVTKQTNLFLQSSSILSQIGTKQANFVIWWYVQSFGPIASSFLVGFSKMAAWWPYLNSDRAEFGRNIDGGIGG